MAHIYQQLHRQGCSTVRSIQKSNRRPCIRAAALRNPSSTSNMQQQPQELQAGQMLRLQQQQQRGAVQHTKQTGRIHAVSATAAAAALLAAAAVHPDAASALTIHAEPSNALSLPTWAIHVSSVTEWIVAMALFWKYAEVTGNQRWKGMTWGMMPSLGSAMAACTWHFFYNSPDLDFLVALQAFLTVVGNCTCWIAAYRIYTAAQAEQPSA